MLYLSGVISVSVSFRAVSPLKNFLSHKVRRLQVLLKRQTVDRLFHLLQSLCQGTPGTGHIHAQKSLSLLAELPLPDATTVLPGHGESSTLGQERSTNPYMNGAWY